MPLPRPQGGTRRVLPLRLRAKFLLLSATMTDAPDIGTAEETRRNNRVPIIDRMMEILAIVERRADGASIRELCAGLDIPRSTAFRILTTLQHHDMVRRSRAGTYVLGPRLLALAARVTRIHGADLTEIATAHLRQLSASTGESSKLSVRDGNGILVIAVVSGPHEYGLTLKQGRSLPLHAGAASKLLLANLEEDEIQFLLRTKLRAYTTRTIVDPKKLAAELRKIRRQGWSQDAGEYSNGVHAFAAPIRDAHGKVIAAVSIPYLDARDVARSAKIRAAVIATAAAISNDPALATIYPRIDTPG